MFKLQTETYIKFKSVGKPKLPSQWKWLIKYKIYIYVCVLCIHKCKFHDLNILFNVYLLPINKKKFETQKQ